MSSGEKKEKKSKKKLIGIILAICVIAFLFWPLDEETDARAEIDYDTTEIGGAISSFAQDNRSELLSRLGTSAIRDYYTKVKGNGEDRVTLMIYMNGSDLESEDGSATRDLEEIVKGAGVSDKVNILVQTMGTKKWDSKYGISSKRTQRYRIDNTGLTLVDDSLGQLDCTKTETLANFIKWSAAEYPADRYILLFWNHGGGAVDGFGYDEWVDDESASLTLDEMQSALKKGGVIFDFIGMDCCIMSSLEVCCAFYDYCDYTILSEDFESGIGWYYTDWIRELYNNTSIETKELGKKICDDMVNSNVKDKVNGSNSILALIDETMVKVLYSTWKQFAYQEEETLTQKNYSRKVLPKHGGRILPGLLKTRKAENKTIGIKGGILYDLFFGDDGDETTMEDCCEIDIMSAASSIDSKVSPALKTAISNTLVYVACTEGDSHLTGLSVLLPYCDREKYEQMKVIFGNIGLDQEYIKWLERFVDLNADSDYYDYNEFDDSWNGWNEYEEEYDYDDVSFWDILFGDYQDSDSDDFGYDNSYDDEDFGSLFEDFIWGWD